MMMMMMVRFVKPCARSYALCRAERWPDKDHGDPHRRRYGMTATVAVALAMMMMIVVATTQLGVDAQGIAPVEWDGNETTEYYQLEMDASAEVKEREMQELRRRLAGTTLRVTTLQVSVVVFEFRAKWKPITAVVFRAGRMHRTVL